MREIKFRAWDREKCRWLTAVEYESLRINPIQDRYGNGFNLNDCVGTGEMIDRVFYIEFIQFTGLCDESGKEIYEGDIVCGSVSLVNGYDFASDQEIIDDETFQSPITFNNGAFQAFINPWEALLSLDEAVANNVEFTVIGNIHESPELLEAK